MEAYPPEYIEHPYPLIVLSGLAAEAQEAVTFVTGPLITSSFPPVNSQQKDEIIHDFLQHEGSQEIWNGKQIERQKGVVGYKFNITGRVW